MQIQQQNLKLSLLLQPHHSYMANKAFLFSLVAGVVILLHLQMDLAEAASRQLHIHPPPFPNKLSLRNPKPPSFILYGINRYKYTESEAFRPTSPGHSPGVGHKDPPGAP